MDIQAILGEGGPLSRHVPGFRPRKVQQAMAAAIAETLESQGLLITEAGTGTGKTFAYLVPALLSGKRILISTGTRNLQDQLFRRDLPTVRKALGVGIKAALLKGRGNYLCLHRLEVKAEDIPALEPLKGWAGVTRSGDISEYGAIPEDSPLWRKVTSTADNCLGQECEHHARCFLFRARREAMEADVVVVNHHLFCADMALKEEGLGEVLPDVQGVILDEAHQLPEIARQFFGTSLSSAQLKELVQDTLAEHAREAGDMPELITAALNLDRAAEKLMAALGPPGRLAWQVKAREEGVKGALETVEKALDGLRGFLDLAAERGKGLENCHRRSERLLGRLVQVTTASAEDHLQWLDVRPKGFTLHLTPLDIAASFGERVAERRCAFVFTSATLAVGESFRHFTQRLGLTGAREARWPSPFDFAKQALLYLPRGMPDPNDPRFHHALVQAVIPALHASRGRAFLLFTSHRGLRECARLLEGNIPYPLLVQGSASRDSLLERFRALGNGVLLGSSSFWEGVDVRGEALSLVVIDRLPFASPGDPLLQAQVELLKSQGRNPFMEHQLPEAVIALKQGTGRLIRDVHDRGVLMLCDPRILQKPYGKLFLRSLPTMPITSSLREVEAFFARDVSDTGS